jgi:hypothetical protein
MDNLQTNTKAMEELEILLHAREISFDAKEQRLMCFPHIVNIICQHVIAKMSRSALPEDVDDDEEAETNQPRSEDTPNTRAAAYSNDPIARCRKIVVAIRSSGQRRDKFESWIKTGGYFCLFYMHWILNGN